MTEDIKRFRRKLDDVLADAEADGASPDKVEVKLAQGKDLRKQLERSSATWQAGRLKEIPGDVRIATYGVKSIMQRS